MRAPGAGRHGARHRVSTAIRPRRRSSSRQQGFEYLHVVDLDGAFAGKPMNAAAVERILETVGHAACSSAAASATWRRSRPGSARASTASSSAPRRCAIRRS